MPLLHRKPFVREKPPADLRPDERVFYCRVTNEIFRDYDDFFERTILCNSLVWSCAVTGKPGLTYQEALESEKKARHNLQSFPEALIIPVLYLATLTHRPRLHEICDEIFAYVKDRYFVGETVEVVRNNGARLQCKILEVIAPAHHNGMANGHVSSADGDTIVISDSDDSETHNSSAQNGKKKAIIDPSLFKYKVQPIKKELYESVIVKASQLSRRKHLFSRDRLKLFLKQHCEPHDGVIKTKATSIAKYNLAQQNFSYFFPDDPPTFIFSPASRRRGRPPKRASISQEDKITAKQNIQGNRSKGAKEKTRFQRQKEEMQAMAFEKAKLKREKANAIEAKKKEKEDKEKKREELKKIVEEERMKKKEEKERLKIEKEKERGRCPACGHAAHAGRDVPRRDALHVGTRCLHGCPARGDTLHAAHAAQAFAVFPPGTKSEPGLPKSGDSSLSSETVEEEQIGRARPGAGRPRAMRAALRVLRCQSGGAGSWSWGR